MDESFPEIAELKKGSYSAWNMAFSHLWGVALRAARSSSGQIPMEDAEEAASDAIRLAMEQIERIGSVEELCAFVAVIARRRAITRIREKFALKRAPGGALVGREDEEGYDSCETETSNDPSHTLIETETVLLMRDAFRLLDPESQGLLMEKYVEGYSYEELSRKHNIAVGTLCSKVARALRKVQQRLQKSPSLMKELRESLR